MAKLIIKRSTEWKNRHRDIKIYLDNSRIDVISNGEKKTFEIEAGHHKLKTKIDWCESKEMEFNIGENEIKQVKLSGFKLFSGLKGFIVVIVAGAYFLLKSYFHIFHIDPYLLLGISMLLYYLYFLTFGRTKYLVLEDK